MRRIVVLVVLLSVSSVYADLQEYVNKEDSSFAWALKEKTEAESGTAYRLELTSQTWHDIKWEHIVMVYVPKDVKPADSVVLWNTGGKPNPLLSGVMPHHGIPNIARPDVKRAKADLVEFMKALTGDIPASASAPLLGTSEQRTERKKR